MLGKNGLHFGFHVFAAVPHRIATAGVRTLDQECQVSGGVVGLLERRSAVGPAPAHHAIFGQATGIDLVAGDANVTQHASGGINAGEQARRSLLGDQGTL